MTDPNALTSLQLAVLNVLWDRGESTVPEVAAALAADRDLAPTTVATLLTRLDKRGYVERRRSDEPGSRAYVYRAVIDREATRAGRARGLTKDLFEGKVGDLVHHLLSHEQLAPGDLARVRALIDGAERAEGPDRSGGSAGEVQR